MGWLAANNLLCFVSEKSKAAVFYDTKKAQVIGVLRKDFFKTCLRVHYSNDKTHLLLLNEYSDNETQETHQLKLYRVSDFQCLFSICLKTNKVLWTSDLRYIFIFDWPTLRVFDVEKKSFCQELVAQSETTLNLKTDAYTCFLYFEACGFQYHKENEKQFLEFRNPFPTCISKRFYRVVTMNGSRLFFGQLGSRKIKSFCVGSSDSSCIRSAMFSKDDNMFLWASAGGYELFSVPDFENIGWAFRDCTSGAAFTNEDKEIELFVRGSDEKPARLYTINIWESVACEFKRVALPLIRCKHLSSETIVAIFQMTLKGKKKVFSYYKKPKLDFIATVRKVLK